MPDRIQLRRIAGWRMPPNTISAARPGPLGNPFVVGRDGMRAECVDLHRMLIRGHLCMTSKAALADQIVHRDHVYSNRDRLRGINLACWCRGAPCHADTLLEVFNG